jgi:hypothetical protein
MTFIKVQKTTYVIMEQKTKSRKSGIKQVRIKLSEEEYAKLNELKFREQLIDTPTAVYAKSLFDIGFNSKIRK